MEGLFAEFCEALLRRDKAQCVRLALSALDNGVVDIRALYEHILAPSLAAIASNEREQSIAIWEEHVQSSIVRTIIELCYTRVLYQRSDAIGEPRPGAVVFCQAEEYHELGARMTTDFLTMLGFEACFIGANTPQQEALAAVAHLKPQLVCISVTNYYHLSKLKGLIERLRALQSVSFKIVAGGYAVFNTPNARESIPADFFANSFEDLLQIREALL
jgi:methanogenic corrinoid protein MtbC1